MAYSIRWVGAGTAALALFLSAGSADAQSSTMNRGVESVHQPVVNRTDFMLDVGVGPHGLAGGEADRIAGWFDGLGLGYGDTITIDDPMGWHGGTAEDGVAAVVARYGMLIAHDAAPVTAGHPAPGTLRIVVSRATAHVDGCPDWHHTNAEYAGGSASNYGCATATNRRARSASVCPLSSAAPNSVTITSTSLRAVVTGPDNEAAIRLTLPPLAVAGNAMMDRPPLERLPART